MTYWQNSVLALVSFFSFLIGSEYAQAKEKLAPFVGRPLVTEINGQWIGNAISYGPYRDGQEPGEKAPSKAEMAEDLHLLNKHWQLLRVYGTTHCSRALLEVIRDENLPLKVMVGAWIAPESFMEGDIRKPNTEVALANQNEVAEAIALANDFPEIVWAVSIGNETQADWSGHKTPSDLLMKYLREVRSKTTVPITTADDYSFWAAEHSQPIAEEIDFIVMHAHPVWHAKEAEEALDFMKEKYEAVKQAHPDRVIVVGETGWATRRNPEGREKEHVRGIMDEEKQFLACRELSDWAVEQKVVTFMFEAFDENWKGDVHPNEVEKHWGLFRAGPYPETCDATSCQETVTRSTANTSNSKDLE